MDSQRGLHTVERVGWVRLQNSRSYRHFLHQFGVRRPSLGLHLNQTTRWKDGSTSLSNLMPQTSPICLAAAWPPATREKTCSTFNGRLRLSAQSQRPQWREIPSGWFWPERKATKHAESGPSAGKTTHFLWHWKRLPLRRRSCRTKKAILALTKSPGEFSFVHEGRSA